jgi:hypothetical protein
VGGGTGGQRGNGGGEGTVSVSDIVYRSVRDEWMSVERYWKGTDRGVWSVAGMILTGECGALLE